MGLKLSLWSRFRFGHKLYRHTDIYIYKYKWQPHKLKKTLKLHSYNTQIVKAIENKVWKYNVNKPLKWFSAAGV